MQPSEFQTLANSIGSPLTLEGATRLLAYLDAMLVENQSINLTAIRDPETAVMLHALDSASLGCVQLEQPPRSCLDLGTGNGFPGIAIACLFPEAKVALMDRTLKKLTAIGRALKNAGFEDGVFETVQMDAAEGTGRGLGHRFDLVTTRAVGPPQEMGRLAGPLLAPGGSLCTWLSEDTQAPEKLKGGLRLKEVHTYTLPSPADRSRRLAHYAKASPTLS